MWRRALRNVHQVICILDDDDDEDEEAETEEGGEYLESSFDQNTEMPRT